MKKHARLMFGITRKTRFAAGMVVVAVVMVMAVIVLSYVGIFGLRSELCEIAITSDKAGDTYGGVGINCDVIPNINIVRDASFESSTDYTSMLLAGASENSVFLTPDAVAAAGYDTASCSGDTARIISIDSERVMSEKFTGKVTGFKPAKLGVVSPIIDAKDLWDEDRICEMAFFGNTAVALTENGRLIYDVTNSQLTGVVESDERFAKIASNDSGIIAVTLSGSIYTSQDGRNLVLVYSPVFDDPDTVLCGIGSTGQAFAVCYTDGTVISVMNGRAALSSLPNSNATAFVSDGKRLMATDIEGNIYSSTNGMVFEPVGQEEWLTEDEKPEACASDGRYCFVVNRSRAVIVSSGEQGFILEKNEIAKSTGAEISSAYLTDTGLIIVGTADRKAFAVNLLTGNTAAITSENVVIEKIIGVSGDKVYYDSGKEIYRSQILSELALEGKLEGVDVIADDILIIGHSQKAASGSVSAAVDEGDDWSVSDTSAWDIYGRGTAVIVSDRSYSGKNGARLSGSGTGVHAMTQKLQGTAADNFIPGTFYRLSLYAMSDNAPDKVYCWVEGEEFGRYGFELTQVGGNYKYFSYVFAVTDQMTDDSEISLNIAFEGSGSILIDDIYLGPDNYDSAGIPQYYADTLASGNPSAVRLNNLNIGCDGFAETSLYLMSEDSVSRALTGTTSRSVTGVSDAEVVPSYAGQSVTASLEDCFRLVKKCNSSPWLVIGPYVNQGDVDKLLEYMCGSMTSEYGGRRIENGTALPWSRQFTRFYIEISDSSKVFKSDLQKSSYVNYVISMFTQSEYFSDIKDKTVFLDGMEYSGGSMMSDADNHTMAVRLTANDSSATYIDNINTSYVIAQYQTPHIVSGNNVGEYIYVLDTDGSNCGKIVSAIMTQEADFAEMFLFDASVNFVPSSYTGSGIFVKDREFVNMMTVSSLTTGFAGYDELYIDIKEPLDKDVPVSVEQFMSNITSACYNKGGKSYLVISNPTTTQQSFLINDNKLGRSDSIVRRYDEEGRLINERKMRYEHIRHILQPGEFLIVEIDAK